MLVYPAGLAMLQAQTPFSESPLIQWEETIGGRGYEYLRKIFPYGRDSVLLAGSSSTQGSVNGDKRTGCVY
ncbi:MAG: hypothetical protein NW226_13305 [Microscillaceae bacterium]|nr:hypothetical protein [Microscillaceae bacterium]